MALQEQHKPHADLLAGERETNRFNACVGHSLISETGRVRVWEIHLRPGERIGFHRHVLDYFWVCHSHGRSLSNHEDGSVIEAQYRPGDVVQHVYPKGKYKLHDLTNIGETDLYFTTVEFLDSENQPLPLPDQVVRRGSSNGSRDD